MDASVKYHQTQVQLFDEMKMIELSKENPVKFEVLYNKYYQQIFNYVKNRVEDQETAFDVTSQVFLKALNNIHKYEYRGVPFSSWLYRIAKSEVYQLYRDEKAKKHINIDVSELNHLIYKNDHDVDQEEKIAKALVVIKKLKPNELSLIELRFFEKRSFKEIADILYITENNAKVRCFRILNKLRTMMPSVALFAATGVMG